jgi:hypothetical protein
LERTDESFFFLPIDNRKCHPAVAAFEIILQGSLVEIGVAGALGVRHV